MSRYLNARSPSASKFFHGFLRRTSFSQNPPLVIALLPFLLPVPAPRTALWLPSCYTQHILFERDKSGRAVRVGRRGALKPRSTPGGEGLASDYEG